MIDQELANDTLLQTFFLLIFIHFSQHYQTTVASLQPETESKFQARRAQDGQGMYMHDVFAHVSNYTKAY